jgi:hypothetical protein
MRGFAHITLVAALVSCAAPLCRAESPAIQLAARAFQPGELMVVTIPTSAAAAAVRVRAFGHRVPVFDSGDGTLRALIGIDLDVPPGAQTVTIDLPDGIHVVKTFAVTRRRFPTRQLTVDPDFVTPPPAAGARIAREAHMLAALWTTSSPERQWAGAFERPVPGEANSSFGTRSIFNGQPRSPHGGADFPSPAGTPVHAPAAGRVVVAEDLYFSGNTLIIDHGLGLFSMLAHLSSFEAREGDRVEAGRIVGLVGATGRVTGPHLHWAVRVNGARVDPLSVLATLR